MGFPKLKFIPQYAPTILVGLLVLYLTLFPRPVGAEMVEVFPGADKLVHFIMFGVMCGTFLYDRWRFGRPCGPVGAFIAAIAVSLIGVAIEWLQTAMGMGRSEDIIDAIADAVGAFAAIPICGYLHWVNIIKDH